MSVHVSSAVWRLALPATAKLVLLKLADCANDDGSNAYPSLETVARECGCDVRTVRRTVRNLEERGLLEVEAEATRYTPRRYRVRPESGTPLAPRRADPVSVEGGHHARADGVAGRIVRPHRADPLSSQGGSSVRTGRILCPSRGDPVPPDPSVDPSVDPSKDPSVEPAVGACAPEAAAAGPDGAVDGGVEGEERDVIAQEEVFGAAVEVLSRAGIAVTALLGEEVAAEIEAGSTLGDFEYAALEAGELNVRQFRYVRTILRRLREERAEEPRTATAIVRTNPFERCDCGRIDRAHVRRVCAGLPPVPAALVGVTG